MALEARIGPGSGLMTGYLLCGKRICRGRLGRFSRDYTTETLPANFVTLDELDIPDTLRAQHNYLHVDPRLLTPAGMRCPVCRLPNVTSAASIDRQLVQRYEGLRFDVAIIRCVTSSGDSTLATYDTYLSRPRGGPADAWREAGQRNVTAGFLAGVIFNPQMPDWLLGTEHSRRYRVVAEASDRENDQLDWVREYAPLAKPDPAQTQRLATLLGHTAKDKP